MQIHVYNHFSLNISSVISFIFYSTRFRWHPHQSAGDGTRQPRILPQKPNLKAVLFLMRNDDKDVHGLYHPNH